MYVGHGPVSEATGSQSTPITHAVTENAPGVTRLVTILPDRSQDFLIGTDLSRQPISHKGHLSDRGRWRSVWSALLGHVLIFLWGIKPRGTLITQESEALFSLKDDERAVDSRSEA